MYLVRLCVALHCNCRALQGILQGTRHFPRHQRCMCVSLSLRHQQIIGGFGQLFQRRTSQVSGALAESDFIPCKYVPSKVLSGFQRCCCVAETWIRNHSRRCQHSFLLKCGCKSFPSCSLQYVEHQWNTSQLRRICCSCAWSARRSTIHSTLVLHCQPSYICPLPSQASPYQAC